MYQLIFQIFNMSVTATIIALAVMLLRLMLKRAPKWISYALWSVVLFRLLCPFSFSAELSLLGGIGAPAAERGIVSYIPEDIVHTATSQVDLIIPDVNEAVNSSLPQGEEQLVADPLEAPAAIATSLWLLGVTIMLAYSAVSFVLLKRRLSDATLLQDNVFETDGIASPFVCGLIKPCIYLPVGLPDTERDYILLHERTHIRRRDHLVKPLAFLALSVHWFNPVMWLSFRLMSRDMEMSCDERVARELDPAGRAGYSATLLRLAMKRSIFAGSPLAFGESGVKERVKNILNYKKPALWVMVIGVVACVTAGVFLLANPAARLSGADYQTGYSAAVGGGTDYEGVNLTLRDLKLDARPTILTVTWHNGSGSDVTFGDYYWIYKYENGEWVSCATENGVGFNALAYPLPAGQTQIKNYYNYSFDLSRAGTYRLESYFFFDQDIPITEDEHYNVWLDFEITGDTPLAAALETGVYAVNEILYSSLDPAGKNPADETLPMYRAQVYSIEPSAFRIADAQRFAERAGFSGLAWQAHEVSVDQWYGMFPAGTADVDIGGYASRVEYTIGGPYRLYLMDGEVWLAEINGNVLQSLLKLQRTDITLSPIAIREVPDIPDNQTLRVDSPDRIYRAEAYGTNKGITAAGLYPYEGLRVIRNSDETTVWNGYGYYRVEFLWSNDSKYVAVYGEARIYGECFIVDANTGKVIQLPGIDTLSPRLGAASRPAANRPDPYFQAMEWVNDTTIRVNYRWTAQESGKEVSGSYECNIVSGDIVAITSQISDPPG